MLHCQASESRKKILLLRMKRGGKVHLFFQVLKGKSNEWESEMVFSFLGKNRFNLQVTAEVTGAYTRKLFRKTEHESWVVLSPL